MEFILRPWRREDVPDYQKIMDNERVSAYLTDGVPYPFPLEKAERYIEGALSAAPDQQYHRAIEVEGKLAGGTVVRRQADITAGTGVIGYSIGEAYWGGGLATRVVAQVCGEAFAQLDIRRIQATVFSPNQASCRVLEKNGFTLEVATESSVVKRGVVMGERIYGLLKEEYHEPT